MPSPSISTVRGQNKLLVAVARERPSAVNLAGGVNEFLGNRQADLGSRLLVQHEIHFGRGRRAEAGWFLLAALDGFDQFVALLARFFIVRRQGNQRAHLDKNLRGREKWQPLFACLIQKKFK